MEKQQFNVHSLRDHITVIICNAFNFFFNYRLCSLFSFTFFFAFSNFTVPSPNEWNTKLTQFTAVHT